MPQAAARPRKRNGAAMPRVELPPYLCEKVCAYRHEARLETRAQAVRALIAAGLAALAKPPTPPPQPDRPRKLVPYVGADPREKSLS
jgi:hypothetical protein